MNVNWDDVASEADDKSPARHFGDLERYRAEGRLGRYVIVYEFKDDEGETTIRGAWSNGEPLWALGALEHGRSIVQATWVVVEDDDR